MGHSYEKKKLGYRSRGNVNEKSCKKNLLKGFKKSRLHSIIQLIQIYKEADCACVMGSEEGGAGGGGGSGGNGGGGVEEDRL